MACISAALQEAKEEGHTLRLALQRAEEFGPQGWRVILSGEEHILLLPRIGI